MKPIRLISVIGLPLALALFLGTSACHYARDTAGRPDAEQGDGSPGSAVATKEGTGDAKVGAGRGQVGTDAPTRSESTGAPTSTGEKSDATGGKTLK